jgi:hypothetical protein
MTHLKISVRRAEQIRKTGASQEASPIQGSRKDRPVTCFQRDFKELPILAMATATSDSLKT